MNADNAKTRLEVKKTNIVGLPPYGPSGWVYPPRQNEWHFCDIVIPDKEVEDERGHAARPTCYIFGAYSQWHGPFKKPTSDFREVKICPKCEKEHPFR